MSMGGTLQYPKLKLKYRILYWISIVRLWLISLFVKVRASLDLRFPVIEIVIENNQLTIYSGDASVTIDLTEEYTLFNLYDDLFKFLTKLIQSRPVDVENIKIVSNKLKLLAYLNAQYGYRLSFDNENSKSLAANLLINKENYRRLTFRYAK